jgi:hypothetical protein
MDFKKFGNVVLILGIVVLLYGGFQLVSNQPEEYKRPEYTGTASLGNDVENMFQRNSAWDHHQKENSKRSGKRDDAIKILIAGGIVAFVGLGISYSAKKKE